MARPRKTSTQANTSSATETDNSSINESPFGELDGELPTVFDEPEPVKDTSIDEKPIEEIVTAERKFVIDNRDLDPDQIVDPVPGANPDPVLLFKRKTSAEINSTAMKSVEASYEKAADSVLDHIADEVPRGNKYAYNAKPGTAGISPDRSVPPINSTTVLGTDNSLTKSYRFASNKTAQIVDTGLGAQEPDTPTPEQQTSDPRAREDFIGCVNKTCERRDSCLRYRMKNKVKNVAPFFPEECIVNGNYISILDYPDFTAYDNLTQLEDPAVPSNLPEPKE